MAFGGVAAAPDRAVLAELRAIFAQQQEAAGAKVRAQGALAAAQAKVDTFGAESELSGDEKDALAAVKEAVVAWACQIELHSKRIAQLDEERSVIIEGIRGARDACCCPIMRLTSSTVCFARTHPSSDERKIRACTSSGCPVCYTTFHSYTHAHTQQKLLLLISGA